MRMMRLSAGPPSRVNLPVRRPLYSGKNGRNPRPQRRNRGQHLGLDRALQQAVLVLGGDELRMPPQLRRVLRLGDLPAREVGVAEVAHLALRDQIVERLEGLGDRGQRVGSVQLVQVDPVGLEAAERRLDGEPDVAARAPGRPSRVRSSRPCPCRTSWRARSSVALAARERVAHQRLRKPALGAVDVGGVEERHARVDRRVDHRVRALLGLGDGALSAEVVASDADGGHDEPRRAERTVVDLSHASRVGAGRGNGSRSPCGSACAVAVRGRRAGVAVRGRRESAARGGSCDSRRASTSPAEPDHLVAAGGSARPRGVAPAAASSLPLRSCGHRAVDGAAGRDRQVRRTGAPAGLAKAPSVCSSTRRMFPPASAASWGAAQPREASSARSLG